MEHLSVLKRDVENYLGLSGGEVIVDATLGLGGHSLDILKKIGRSGVLIAFEQDDRNLLEAKKRLDGYKKNVRYVNDNFRYLKTRVTELGFNEVDAVLFDLGLSSPHVDIAERGFSFQNDGPLDMRFNPHGKLTAYDVINAYPEGKLVDIFREYGEVRLAKKLAHLICEDRKLEPFVSTKKFGEFIGRVLFDKRVSRKKGAKRSHPATQVFQAIRIEVNDEMNALKESLSQAVELLNIGGRIVVISYHSVEDRVVKHLFKAFERPEPTVEESIYTNHGNPIVKNITKKPIVPSAEEIEQNPRSRSAKLRVYEKIKEI